MLCPDRRITVIIDVDDLVRIFEGLESVCIVSQADKDRASAMGVGNSADGTIGVDVELKDISQQKVPGDSASR